MAQASKIKDEFPQRRLSREDFPLSPAPSKRASFPPRSSASGTPKSVKRSSLSSLPPKSPRHFSLVSRPELSNRLLDFESTGRGSYSQVKNMDLNITSESGPTRRWLGTFRASLGIFGAVVIVFGTAITLCVMAMLAFLWSGQGPQRGALASTVWRRIILGQWLAQTVTICSAVLRITLAAQAAVGTSLIAAMLLERHGVPLSHLAQISITRSVNDGPLRLAWLMLTSKTFWMSAKLPSFLTIVLLFGALSSQFTSTILLSDLAVSVLVGDVSTRPVAADVDTPTYNLLQHSGTLDGQPAFMPFGESSGVAQSVTPNARGVSDTGFVRRVFLPFQEANRTNLRSYDGKGYVYSSRQVCVRPSIVGGLEMIRAAFHATGSLEFCPWLSGNISFETTFENAGLDFPPDCAAGSCFSSAFEFNCSLPFQTHQGSPDPRFPDELMSMCIPGRKNIKNGGDYWPISDLPIANFSEVYLAFVTNFTGHDVNDVLPELGFIDLPTNPKAQNEFTIFEIEGFSIAVSLCFQQLTFDFADIRLSADRDLPSPIPVWNSTTHMWQSDELMALFDATLPFFPSLNASARGTYTVEKADNLTQTPLTAWMTSQVATQGQGTLDETNYIMFLDDTSNGAQSVQVDVRLQSLFSATMRQTRRPAVALQNLMTSLATSVLAAYIPQFGATHEATYVSSVSVLAPRGWRGLAVVSGVLFTSLGCIGIITLLFLARTKYSSQGDYWRAISQVVSEDTQWVLEEATESNDTAVSAMLKAHGATTVKIGRSYLDRGRVQVMVKRL